jgi:hypothetical protein
MIDMILLAVASFFAGSALTFVLCSMTFEEELRNCLLKIEKRHEEILGDLSEISRMYTMHYKEEEDDGDRG